MNFNKKMSLSIGLLSVFHLSMLSMNKRIEFTETEKKQVYNVLECCAEEFGCFWETGIGRIHAKDLMEYDTFKDVEISEDLITDLAAHSNIVPLKVFEYQGVSVNGKRFFPLSTRIFCKILAEKKSMTL